MKEETKKTIDKMSYTQLLDLWRNAPAGHPYFAGETGKYYKKRMEELRENGAYHARASKFIGWGV